MTQVGGGVIFSIISISSKDKQGLEEEISWPGVIGIIETSSDYIYLLSTPTDVQCPDNLVENYLELSEYFIDILELSLRPETFSITN